MMDLLPETVLNTNYKDNHTLEYTDSINHINMFKQHYDGIPRYTKRVYGNTFPQLEINIPIKAVLMPLQKIEIDTSNTIQLMVNIISYIEVRSV